MKIVLISNFMNHYQLPLADAFMESGCDFHFIATMEVTKERILLGFDGKGNQKNYVVCMYKDRQRADKIIKEADVIISNWDGRKYLKNAGGMVFIYTERFAKPSGSRFVSAVKNVLRQIKYKYYVLRYTDMETRWLCIGDYAVKDFMGIGIEKSRIYKFGYFPALSRYGADRGYMPDGVVRCLWVGRFMDVKRPDDAVRTVSRLFKEGYPVELVLVGRGDLEEKLRKLVSENGAERCISFASALPAEKVREFMHAADIFLFTSTQWEGWGAVLSEAMSEGMAVLAADGAGATTYLVKDRVNGEIYPSSNADVLYKKLKNLLDNRNLIEEYGRNARQTMESCWNAVQAAENFLQLVRCLKNNEEFDISDEPCSPA